MKGKSLFILVWTALFSLGYAYAQIPSPIHGITVADDKDIRTNTYLNKVLTSVGNLDANPTVRLTFTLENDSGQKGALASTYTSAVQQIATKAYILGEVVDSSYMYCFTVADHDARWQDYVSTLGSLVNIWEVGNEINGNWLDNSDPSTIQGQSCPWQVPNTTEQDVITKMIDAYNIVKNAGQLTELTLYYEPNPACDNSLPPAYDPITWATNNVPDSMKNGLDYVFVSFYQDNCPNYNPDWTTLFTQIQSIFPNAKLGMGEWGYSKGRPNNTKLTQLINEGYSIDPSVSNWVGGVFYWEYGLDAVPYNSSPGSIWNVINTDLNNQQ